MSSRIKNFAAAPLDLTKILYSIQSLHLPNAPREGLADSSNASGEALTNLPNAPLEAVTDSSSAPREKLVVILGATSAGKSSLALTLAEMLDTEIISADSMAVYRGFNVGTAKPSRAELERVPHHMIDILDAQEKFSVGEFVRLAKPIITELNLRGKIPIVAGGTGLYIQALVEGYEMQCGMRNAQCVIDSGRSSQGVTDSAVGSMQCGVRNAQCVIDSGCSSPGVTDSSDSATRVKSSSSHYKRTGELLYNARVFGLTAERTKLYDRINRRTAEMFANGLVDEVRALLSSGISPDAQAMLGIGYKETVEYLRGDATLEETIAKVAQATRNFAKRQLTWYRRMKYIHWLEI